MQACPGPLDKRSSSDPSPATSTQARQGSQTTQEGSEPNIKYTSKISNLYLIRVRQQDHKNELRDARETPPRLQGQPDDPPKPPHPQEQPPDTLPWRTRRLA